MKIEEKLAPRLEELKKTMPSNQIDKALTVLKECISKVADLPEPVIAITDEDTVQFAWDVRRFYIDLDIFPDEKLEWYYSDRDQKASTCKTELSDELFQYLSILTAFQKQ